MKDLREFWQVLEEFYQKNEVCLLATVIHTEGSAPRKIGTKAIFNKAGEVIWGTIGGGSVEHAIQKEVRNLIPGNLPIYKEYELVEGDYGICGGKIGIFLELFGENPNAVIVGGGHIGQALAPLLRRLEFNVIVLDPRDELKDKKSFRNIPVITGKSYSELIKFTKLSGEVYYIIVTYNHEGDEESLIECLKRPSAYVGMIGSKRKVRTLFSNLIDRKISTQEQLDTVHAPIGLAIHSETPEEIAVSIAGELIKIRAERRQQNDK
ncbi:MAG: XdhC family protein [Promethearchaeota archaeon]